jgi:hypothetical protein
MKFAEDRPYANPEMAARKLLDIAKAEIAKSGLLHAYVGTTNAAFLRAGSSVAEYTGGRDHAFTMRWFKFERSQDEDRTVAGWR